MSATDVVGQSLPLSIAFLDQNGQPMVNAPAPDSPPVWSNTTPGVETVVAAPNGLTAVATALSAGGDTINLSLAVGGVAFTASLDVTVTAPAPPAQVLTSIAIVPGTPA